MYLTLIMLFSTVAIIYLFSLMLVKYYVDPAEGYFLATLVISVSITLTFLNVLMIPIDILVISSPTIHYTKQDIDNAMQLLYLVTLIINFIIIPFTYFYGEERQEEFSMDFEYDSNNNNIIKRIYNSFKFTLMFIVVLLILFLTLLFFKQNQQKLQQQQNIEWVKQLMSMQQLEREQVVYYFMGLLSCFGTLCFILYTGYGLAVLPFKLIRSEKSLQESKNEVSNDLASIRDKYRSIQEKYVRSHSKISRQDQRLLNNLKKQEHLLSIKQEKIDLLEQQNPLLLQNIFKYLYPFQFIIGLVFLTISLVISISFFTSILDKVSNSKCGFKCGFFIEKQNLFNVMDYLLVKMSKYFPVDFVFFFLLMIYIFIATFYAIIRVGIKFLFFDLYKIKKHETYPQALLLTIFILNMIFLSICTQFLTLIPQYFTFGDQWYLKNNEKVFCSLQAIQDNGFCKMSNISSYAHKIQLSIPFFSMIFFVCNVLFLAVNSFGLLYGFFSENKNNIDDDYDIEVEETKKLLSSNL